jgi:DNA-directed RNA polymerase
MDTLEQLQLEKEKELKAHLQEIQPYKQYKLIKQNLEHCTTHGNFIIREEITRLADYIKPILTSLDEREPSKLSIYYKSLDIITSLEPTYLAYTTLKRATACATYPQTYTDTARKLGNDVVTQYIAIEIDKVTKNKQTNKDIISNNKYLKHKHNKTKLVKSRQAKYIQTDKYSTLNYTINNITNLSINIGGILLTWLLETSRYFTKKLLQVKNSKKSAYNLTLKDNVKQFIDKVKTTYNFFGTSNQPMICKPRDWQQGKKGGFLTDISNKYKLVKIVRDKEHSHNINNIIDMQQYYNAINKLQAIKLKINLPVYDVINQLINSNSTLGGLPDYELITNKTYDKSIFKNNKPSKTEAEKYILKQKLIEKHNSNYLKLHRALKLAKDHLNKSFYNTAYADFRGRIYTTGELSQMNNDPIKALLLFSKGKKLSTKAGIKAFLIYGANLFGLDKQDYEERLFFISANEQYILASANNPYDNKYWTEAKKPFQFLAWCIEYQGYKTNGINHISHLPISIDATCSGSQHLAMLMQDKQLAKQVNLTNNTIHDYYDYILKHVIKLIEIDFNNEDLPFYTYENRQNEDGTIVQIEKPTDKLLAKKWLKYGITRAIIKKPVMTETYNATHKSFEESIYNDITSNLNKIEYFTGVSLHSLSWYLAKKIKKVLKNNNKSYDKLKKYLNKIISATEKPFIYTARTGFQFKQSHYKNKHYTIDIKIPFKEKKSIHLYNCDYSRIDKRKQKTSVLANLTHCLDATHLVLSVNKATELISNFNVLTQHDCIATHACDIPKLKKILKVQMFDLYQDDILLDIKKQNESTYNVNLSHIEQPTKGEFNKNEILKSQYFFN